MLSAQMHEVGHNLGLAHSNEAGPYNDQSGMMGYSYSQDDGPKMCFNSAKSWQLGWFTNKQATFNVADGFWSGRLIGQVDYQNAAALADDRVLLKLNTVSSTDYYVSFNRKTGVNSGTVEGGNQVVLHRAGEGNAYAESELLAKLSAAGSYTIENFDNSGIPLTLTVNAINLGASPAYADVTIITACSSDAQCDDGLDCNGVETCNAGVCVTGPPGEFSFSPSSWTGMSFTSVRATPLI